MDTAFIDDLVAMPSAQLDDVLRATELERRDAEAKLAMIAAVVEQKQQFLTDGHRSMAGYLKAHLNCSGAEASRIRRRGKLINESALAAEAVTAGRVSMSNLDVLARADAHPRVGNRLGEFVPTLIAHAEHFSPKDFEVLVDRVVANLDADGADPHDDHDASATVTAGPDGVFITVCGGTALQAAEMKAIFELAVEAEFQADVKTRRAEYGDAADQHRLPRTARQRRFAAQYAIHMAYVTVPAEGQRPEPIVNILYTSGRAGRTLSNHGLADDDVFGDVEADLTVESANDPLAGRCETSTGVTIGDHDAVRAMIRGHIRRAVIDAAGVVVDLGARRRLFTGGAREAAQLIALSCAHPGCSVPAEFCDIDHLERHADGGLTDQYNSAPVCGSHNRFKEQAGLRSRRATNGRIHLIRPDGSVISAAGEREPEWADNDPPTPEPTPTSVDPPHLETVTWNEYLTRKAARSPERCTGDWPLIRLTTADPAPLT